MIYKLMWVPESTEVIWDINTESQVQTSSDIYISLKVVFDLDNWISDFSRNYTLWLEDQTNEVYDVRSNLNIKAIHSLREYNLGSHNKIYYWFDVDRDKNGDYKWLYCPISKKELKDLGISIHPNNRKVSEDYPLIFPDYYQ